MGTDELHGEDGDDYLNPGVSDGIDTVYGDDGTDTLAGTHDSNDIVYSVP